MSRGENDGGNRGCSGVNINKSVNEWRIGMIREMISNGVIGSKIVLIVVYFWEIVG